jgi:hypothetical protein
MYYILYNYRIQHCFIWRPTDPIISKDAGLGSGLFKHSEWQSDDLSTSLDLVHYIFTPPPLSSFLLLLVRVFF